MDSNLSLNMCLQGKAGSVGKALAVGTGEWMNGLAIHLCSVDFLIEPFSFPFSSVRIEEVTGVDLL
jgi:hypothetical protein